MRNSLLLALSALTLAAGVPAAAEDLVVRYSDLNLSTAKGQKTLDNRIDAAARKYCGVDGQQTGTRVRDAGAARCFKDARTAAQEQVAALVAKSANKGG